MRPTDEDVKIQIFGEFFAPNAIVEIGTKSLEDLNFQEKSLNSIIGSILYHQGY